MTHEHPAPAEDRTRLTQLLRAWSGGDDAAAEAVLSLVYAQVRAIAAKRLRAEGRAAALDPTELAHELMLNLLEASTDWQDRAHFFRTCAVAMRNILADLARRQGTGKHGGGQMRVTMRAVDAEGGALDVDDDAGALHEALAALRAQDPRKADVIELVHLVGLGLEETARTLDVSLATVNRDLRFARAWLKQRLEE